MERTGQFNTAQVVSRLKRNESVIGKITRGGRLPRSELTPDQELQLDERLSYKNVLLVSALEERLRKPGNSIRVIVFGERGELLHAASCNFFQIEFKNPIHRANSSIAALRRNCVDPVSLIGLSDMVTWESPEQWVLRKMREVRVSGRILREQREAEDIEGEEQTLGFILKAETDILLRRGKGETGKGELEVIDVLPSKITLTYAIDKRQELVWILPPHTKALLPLVLASGGFSNQITHG